MTSYRAHIIVARIEGKKNSVQKPEDKSIDHRERSKSPPRIPTISLSGHSPMVLLFLPRGASAQLPEEKADNPDKEAETKGIGRRKRRRRRRRKGK